MVKTSCQERHSSTALVQKTPSRAGSVRNLGMGEPHCFVTNNVFEIIQRDSFMT
jgi:hypothetical protein